MIYIKLDRFFSSIQIYSYLLPTDLLGMKLGNKIQDLREKYIIPKLKQE